MPQRSSAPSLFDPLARSSRSPGVGHSSKLTGRPDHSQIPCLFVVEPGIGANTFKRQAMPGPAAQKVQTSSRSRSSVSHPAVQLAVPYKGNMRLLTRYDLLNAALQHDLLSKTYPNCNPRRLDLPSVGVIHCIRGFLLKCPGNPKNLAHRKAWKTRPHPRSSLRERGSAGPAVQMRCVLPLP